MSEPLLTPNSCVPALAIREPGPAPGYSQSQPPFLEPEFEDPGISFSHYLWVLRRHSAKILAFVVVCMFGAYVVSSRLRPIYEATTTVDVDRQAAPGVVGQDAQRSSAANDADPFLSTQATLIQSDEVLRPVVEKYNLLELEKQNVDSEKVSREAVANAPLALRNLRVVRPPNTFLLLISYRSPDPNLAAEVSNGIARSYLEHTYNIRIRSSASLASFMEKQLEELRAKMERSSQARLRFEREMNLIDPEEKTTILSARLLQLNTEYTTSQGDRVRKEVAYQSARAGTLEAALTSTQGDMVKRLVERLNEAQQKFTEVQELYGARHPEYRKAAGQVDELKRQIDAMRESILKRVELDYNEAVRREAILVNAVAVTKAEHDRINARGFEYQQLKREAEADKQLYEELVRKIRESVINAGFQNNSIRLADVARPPVKPVFPNTGLNLMLAFLLSTVLALGAAVVSDVLDKSIRDPEQVAHTLSTQVLGSLPLIRERNFRSRLIAVEPSDASQASSAGGVLVLNGSNGHAPIPQGETNGSLTLFEESMRTLHSSILLSDLDQGIRSLLITSIAPGEGKSTMAAYLAISNAEQGHSTLLIDADLRRPSIHRMFGISPTTGLSSVLADQAPWRDAVIKLQNHGQLDLLPAGVPSRRAADLVARGLQALVDAAEREYSLIIIDSPPFLNFAEPLRMSTMVDGVLLVTVAGKTNRQAAASVLATLKRIRANVVGLVLNKVTRQLMENYHYYGYHGYNGKYYKRYYSELKES